MLTAGVVRRSCLRTSVCGCPCGKPTRRARKSADECRTRESAGTSSQPPSLNRPAPISRSTALLCVLDVDGGHTRTAENGLRARLEFGAAHVADRGLCRAWLGLWADLCEGVHAAARRASRRCASLIALLAISTVALVGFVLDPVRKRTIVRRGSLYSWQKAIKFTP